MRNIKHTEHSLGTQMEGGTKSIPQNLNNCVLKQKLQGIMCFLKKNVQRQFTNTPLNMRGNRFLSMGQKIFYINFNALFIFVNMLWYEL